MVDSYINVRTILNEMNLIVQQESEKLQFIYITTMSIVSIP